MSGLFITFEGPECAGKTTQIKLLSEALSLRGRDVLCTREPGGTPLAEAMRGLLLNKGDEPVTVESELLLFSAGRAQHVAHLIRPHLKKGGIVICDRFIDSTTAYQGYARGIPLDFIQSLNAFAIGETVPDITFLLDLPLTETRRRLALRNGIGGEDRMEAENNAFHQKVRDGFLQIAVENPQRFRVVDACQSIEVIADYILTETENAIGRI